VPEDTTRENILADAGYEQVYDIDEIITRMPTPGEIERLGISTGTPVAERIRTGYTANNRPVRSLSTSFRRSAESGTRISADECQGFII
jgi:DNA-binding GntR family transcriptional regulator